MLCPKCGTDSDKSIRFCIECGSALENTDQVNKTTGRNLIGFSPRIHDPAFAKYIKDTKRWSFIFASIIAIAAVAGFYIYGETSSEMDNPEALYIGLGIGGMFMVIALLQTIGRKMGTTWDGQVVDKKIEKKQRKRQSGSDHYWENYTSFIIVIQSDTGKIHNISTDDDDTVFNYYQIGDRVRHHRGLNSYEKYDKSKDAIIFCTACASLNNIQDDRCFRCQCPLLK